MFNLNQSQYPAAPEQQGNLADIIPSLMNGGGAAMGALGGFGGGNSFMNSFNSGYGQRGQDNRIDMTPMLSNALGQSNFSQLNTLGGLVPPMSGGLY